MNLPNEEWRPIPDVIGYQASNHGRIRGPKGMRKLVKDRDGYLRFSMRSRGTSRSMRVHSAVLLAFIGPYPDGQEIRHLDGNPANNAIENLAYGTPKKNGQDRIRHGTSGIGERNVRAKLTEADVRAIRCSHLSSPQEAKRHGVSTRLIRLIRRGERWKHIA